MKVREYLDQFPSAALVTFIKQAAGGVYSTAPVRSAWEWLDDDVFCDGYLVINADHAPIDVGGVWGARYRSGHLRCAVITTEAALLEQYGEEQGREMVAYYERTVR